MNSQIFPPAVLEQLVEGSLSFAARRRSANNWPHVRLIELGRIHELHEAFFDALLLADSAGAKALKAVAPDERLAIPILFRLSLEAGDSATLANILEVARAQSLEPESIGEVSGWSCLDGLPSSMTEFLASSSAYGRRVAARAISACIGKGKDILWGHIADPDAALRRIVARSVGESGHLPSRPDLLNTLADADPETRYWAARSLVLMGDRRTGLDALVEWCRLDSSNRQSALRLALRVLPLDAAGSVLHSISNDPRHTRLLIQGAGIAGDPHYVPWLIRHLDDLKLTRLAGESISMITGIDIAYLDLDRKPPEGFESGPNDDPNDDMVDTDPDDGLPWPDPVRISEWWQANAARFSKGQRFFMGASPTVSHCRQVLRDGFQRQRTAAALYLSILQPATPLFPTTAPTWKQRRLLVSA